VTFDELEKDSIINLRFRSIRNTLLDYKLKSRSRNKVLRLKKQKTVPRTFKQFKDYNINFTESRLTISIEVPKKSVT
jgi:hypothetical protein